jgi:hypothetical protein
MLQENISKIPFQINFCCWETVVKFYSTVATSYNIPLHQVSQKYVISSSSYKIKYIPQSNCYASFPLPLFSIQKFSVLDHTKLTPRTDRTENIEINGRLTLIYMSHSLKLGYARNGTLPKYNTDLEGSLNI